MPEEYWLPEDERGGTTQSSGTSTRSGEQLDAAADNVPAVPALLLIPDEDHNEVPPEFVEAAEAYRELQEDAMDLFDPGEVRLVASPHYMEPEIPEEIAAAVREVIDGPASAEASMTSPPTTSN